MSIDRDTERRVSDWLQPGPDTMPDHVLRDVIDSLPTTPQTRRRTLGRWFQRGIDARRGSDAHEQTASDTRRTRLMFSATGLVAAFAILALAVNVAGPVKAPPEAGAGQQLIVAADGSGDYSSINDAVAAAEDGDTVMVRPGLYAESVTIDKDITLAGDGPREDIVVVAPAEGPTRDVGPGRVIGVDDWTRAYAIVLVDTTADLSGITFDGADANVIADGGAPRIAGLRLDGAGIYVTAGSTAHVTGNEVRGPDAVIGVRNDAAPLIEGNVLSGGYIGVLGHADGTVVSGNEIDRSEAPGSAFREGIYVFGGGSISIEGNTISAPGTYGIVFRHPDVEGGPAIVADNAVSGATQAGISIDGSIAGEIRGNRVEGGRLGVQVSSDRIELVADNTVRRSQVGIVIETGSSEVAGNDVSDGMVGMTIASGASPSLSGNVLCGNERNLVEGADSGATIDDTNQICADTATS